MSKNQAPGKNLSDPGLTFLGRNRKRGGTITKIVASGPTILAGVLVRNMKFFNGK